MREILFRGKTFDGEWLYGDLWNGIDKYINSHVCIMLVDPDTVSEFTGLTDKNGKRIFEGDIVEYEDPAPAGIQRDIVVWSLGEQRKTAGFGLKHHIFYSITSEDSKIFKVIGNKWDNPELLTEVE